MGNEFQVSFRNSVGKDSFLSIHSFVSYLLIFSRLLLLFEFSNVSLNRYLNFSKAAERGMPVNAASLPYQLLWEHFPPHPLMHVHTPACTYALEKVTESLDWGQLLLALIVVVEDLTVSDCWCFLFLCIC